MSLPPLLLLSPYIRLGRFPSSSSAVASRCPWLVNVTWTRASRKQRRFDYFSVEKQYTDGVARISKDGPVERVTPGH